MPPPTQPNATPRGARHWLLLVLLLAWQVALTVVVGQRLLARTAAPPASAVASTAGSLDETVLGIMLMDLNDQLALTPDQAQAIGPALDLVASASSSPTVRDPLAHEKLEALLSTRVLTSAQRAWLAKERAVVRAALVRNPWTGEERMLKAFAEMVKRRSSEAIATMGGNAASDAAAPMTHLAFLTGLLLLETSPATALTQEQALELQRSLAPALETTRMTTTLQEQVPSDVLGHLEERQKLAMRRMRGSTVLLDDQALPLAQLPGTVEHLLQARAAGNVFPRRVTRGAVTAQQAATTEAALATATPAPEVDEGPVVPGVHLRGPQGLVLTQYLVGITALEKEPALALDAVQATRLHALLPELRQAFEATMQRTEVPGVLNVETTLNGILRLDQKRYIAANVAETAPVDNLFENLQAVIEKHMARPQGQASARPRPTR